MSSPSYRFSITGGGPSRTMLQKLLEEIENDRKIPAPTRAGSLSYDRSRTASQSLLRHSATSLWVGGNSAAEDARRKLRAVDEARQRKHSTPSAGSTVTPASVKSEGERPPAQSHDEAPAPAHLDTGHSSASWSSFSDVQFGRAATWTAVEEPSPTSEFPEPLMQSKRERERSNSSSPDMLLKRLRTSNPHGSPPARHHHRSDGSEASMRGGGRIIVTSLYPQQLDLGEPSTHSRSASLAERAVSRRPSAFQLFDNSPKSSRRTSTPRRSASRMDGSQLDSPGTPPAWTKPLQLVDGDQAIYLSAHGDDWMDHALCLHCFRLHGSFHRVLSRGCEVCGSNELLEGHYWERPNHYHE